MYPVWCNNRSFYGYRKCLAVVLNLYAELVVSSVLYVRNWVQTFSNAICHMYRGADKFLARSTSRCILVDGENISFGSSLVIYIYIYKLY